MTLPWFKCYPRDFREGMTGLTCEERGAYATLLLLIYERGEPIPDDDSWIASQLWCSVRAWKKTRAALIVKGKLFAVNLNGVDCLMNRRAADELAKTAGICTARSEAGKEGGKQSAAKRAPKPSKNNDLGEANASALVKQTPSNGQADITDYENSSVASPNGESTGGEPPRDLNREAWEDSLGVLVGQGAMTVPAAKAFFGKLLSAHGLEARDMLAPLAEALNNGTQNPQAYLTRAAISRAKRRAGSEPEKRQSFV